MKFLLKVLCFFGKHRFSEWQEAKFVSADTHRRQRQCSSCSQWQEEVVPHDWTEIESDLDVCLQCQTARIWEKQGRHGFRIRYNRKLACADDDFRNKFA